jgi:FkbM family methyltransferase
VGLGTSIKKRFHWLVNVKFDKSSGFYTYERYGHTIYIRHKRHFKNKAELEWECTHLFFHYYLPKNDDVVVDLGAGYGEEATYIFSKSPNVRYLGVEAQPVVYECLANTYHGLSKQFHASPFVITGAKEINFFSQLDYAATGKNPEGYIEIPTIRWNEFLNRYNIQHIDLLKMNIEGAEKDVLAQIEDFSIIKRLVISCHDFRAVRGDGDWFKTKDFVVEKLKSNGYEIKEVSYGIPYADDWIYAERPEV